MRVQVLGAVAVAIFFGMLACGKPTDEAPEEPTIRTDRDGIDGGFQFTPAYVGTSRQEALMIENLGRKELVISSVDKTGDDAFVLEAPQNLTVPPRGHTFFRFFFTPKEARTYSGAIVIHSNAVNEPQKTVAYTGIGVAPPQADGGTDGGP
ncbi:MAG: hypothetical protein IRZ16_16015 [Myxococcaceae bacterium]|nr:hypothetical protein [Myxococcaceae bacterium]